MRKRAALPAQIPHRAQLFEHPAPVLADTKFSVTLFFLPRSLCFFRVPSPTQRHPPRGKSSGSRPRSLTGPSRFFARHRPPGLSRRPHGRSSAGPSAHRTWRRLPSPFFSDGPQASASAQSLRQRDMPTGLNGWYNPPMSLSSFSSRCSFRGPAKSRISSSVRCKRPEFAFASVGKFSNFYSCSLVLNAMAKEI